MKMVKHFLIYYDAQFIGRRIINLDVLLKMTKENSRLMYLNLRII